MDDSELLTPREAAGRLRASVPTLARWRCHGTGPTHVKRGGRVFYREADLVAYLDAATRTSTRDREAAATG